MTIHETHAQPPTHPYRSAVEPSPADGDGLRVRYHGQARMRLALFSGLSHARIVIDPDAQDLIAIRCGEGLSPQLQVMAGEIALTWRVSFRDWLRRAVQPCQRDVAIVLHPAVEWTLAIRGGLSHTALELAAGTIARVDVHGGCSDVQLALPLPRTVVPISVAGGASRLVVQRPAEVEVALAASGGVTALRLDDQRFDAIGGASRLETSALVPGTPRYELQLAGGATDLVIERRER